MDTQASPTTDSRVTIRAATIDDLPAVVALVRELAAYEQEPDAVVATLADFARHGFGESPRFHTLVAEVESIVVGFALYFFGFSTWRGAPTLHLEDLFVQPAHRKKRLGLSLMQALAREAKARSCQRFVWQVLDWNAPAIGFYESLGATVRREWLTVRLDGDALDRLAATGER
jgi:GNAT superfamily N-acetyltransferase